MDFQDPRDIAAHFGRPVDDCRRLLAFHGLRSGAPQYLPAFARKLEDSKPFRTDLTALLRSTRDLEHGRITSDQMLAVVAVAVGGEALLLDPAASPATTHTITLVLMLLAGIGGWSDTGGRAATAADRTSTSPATPRDSAPPARPRFAAAPTPPPDAPAVDVRGFVRSEVPADARAETHANHWPDARAELRSDTHAPSQPRTYADTRSEAPQTLRREPLSEIVRPPTSPEPSQPPPSGWNRKPTTLPAVTDPTFARSPMPRSSVVETLVPPNPQTRPTSQTKPPPPARTEPELTPEAHLENIPSPPHWETQPIPIVPLRSAPLRSASDVLPSDDPASIAVAPPETQAPAPEPASPDFHSQYAEPSDPVSGARPHPIPRKLALDAVLATAAVGLLLFGIFEGLHARHAAPAQTTGQTTAKTTPPQTPTAAIVPSTAPEPPRLASVEPPAPTSGPETSPIDTTPRHRDTSASSRAIRPTDTSIAGDLPSAPAAVSRSATSASRSEPATLTRAADLQPPPHGPVTVPEPTMNARLLATHKPVYPPAALAGNVTGTVVLRAFVSTDGTVRRTDVIAGPPALVNSALAAASWRRYRPFVLGGRPVEVQTEITYHYIAP